MFRKYKKINNSLKFIFNNVQGVPQYVDNVPESNRTEIYLNK